MRKRKPMCWLCGYEIEANEHYYVIRHRTICKKCEAGIWPRPKHKVEVIVGGLQDA